jgi:nucleoside-diphosphate-sugar epimerase
MLDRVLILGGGGILGPSVVEELGDTDGEDKSPFNLRVTDVHADKRNPGSQPLQLPEGHEYVEIDIATNDEVVAAVSLSNTG